jgi:hypothetical protein
LRANIRIRLLGFYNLILSIGAIYAGILMVSSNSGIFTEYPKEWISKTPFESWFPIGGIAIVIFGLGNFIASILCFIGKANKGSIMSVIMGGTLFLCLVFQVIILGEWYLGTLEFMLVSIVQLGLSTYILYSNRNRKMQIE